jgi:hypothetical protein
VLDRAASYREAARVLRRGGRVRTVTDSERVIRSRKLSKYFPETVEIELRRYPSIHSLRSYREVAGFIAIREDLVEHSFFFTDAAPVRDNVFSSLFYLDEEDLRRGSSRLESDLASGPVGCLWRYVLLWGTRA